MSRGQSPALAEDGACGENTAASLRLSGARMWRETDDPIRVDVDISILVRLERIASRVMCRLVDEFDEFDGNEHMIGTRW